MDGSSAVISVERRSTRLPLPSTIPVERLQSIAESTALAAEMSSRSDQGSPIATVFILEKASSPSKPFSRP
jgi:hypothetical protein